MSNGAQREMPRYRCHKIAHALKIKSVATSYSEDGTVSHANLIPEDNENYGPIWAGPEWFNKHNPTGGGYYIVYEDGYTSFSPAKAFENGYTLIEQKAIDKRLVGILQFFSWMHLPPHLQAASRPFSELAHAIAQGPVNPETSVALRKLLEAKDAAVRSVLFKE